MNKHLLLLSTLSTLSLTTPIKQLKAPNLNDDQIIGYNVGLRPYRTSGIRIEKQRINSKTVIHNYGYGGSGLTLSWGGAQEAVALLDHESLSKEKSIAIIGCGVIGLTVAHTLLDMGYKVHIYAREFPPHTTSNIAAGLYSPYAVSLGNQPGAQQRFERMCTISWQKLSSLATTENPEFAGVVLMDFYHFENNVQNHPAAIKLHFDNGMRRFALVEHTLIMQGPIYMQQLFDKAQAKGAVITHKELDNLSDIFDFPETIIFNCTGLGARQLCGDRDVVAIRGHLIYLKPQDINYMATYKIPCNTIFFSMYPWPDRLIIAGSTEYDEGTRTVDMQVCQEIMEYAREQFKNI